MKDETRPSGLIAGIVDKFLQGPASILFLMASLSLGVAAIALTPREEEPQIVVPMADIHVQYPGASAQEVEKLVAAPLERLLWQIDGVEYVYSVSSRGRAVVTVRFYVGEDRERSLVKLHNRIVSHEDEIPPGVTSWIVKPVEIDDVPIVTVALYSKTADDYTIRRVAEEVRARMDAIDDISRTRIAGGRRREVRIVPDLEALEARGLGLVDLTRALSEADVALDVGAFDQANERIHVSVDGFLRSAEDVESLVIQMDDGRPIRVRDVAKTFDGPEEATNYTRIGFGAASMRTDEPPGVLGETYPAVTLALAKKKGVNAVAVADAVIDEIGRLKLEMIPEDIEVVVTRDYGQTADAKVNELLSSLGFAMLTVIGLLVVTLGWREGLVVAMAVPVSFALALFVNFIFGYTINRVTLFALILTLGLVVDDPITNVDNIQRHILTRVRGAYSATLWAVQEVLPPVILSTVTIIISFLPMFFITGMMGPYMQPMAVNVPLAVTFSTVAAVSIVPWAAYKLLRKKADRAKPTGESGSTRLQNFYASMVGPLLDSHWKRKGLFALVICLLTFSGALVVFRLVPMKMLPFDNKNELQLVIDMPEGTTLEHTDAVVREFERYLFTVPEVADFESYVGSYSPIDFNGLVRHYYFRERAHLADIRINLASKERRKQQSHAIGLRLRDDLKALADSLGAKVALVESPPGPPVIATLVAEITGAEDRDYEDLIHTADLLMDRMALEPGVVDIDASFEAPHTRLAFHLDKEKAAMSGITSRMATQALAVASKGGSPAGIHDDNERESTPVVIRLNREDRSGRDALENLSLRGSHGELVPIMELGRFEEVPQDQPIYHKNLRRVVYVFGEMAGRAPGETVLDLEAWGATNGWPSDIDLQWAGEGEWKITLRVFRDLGLAFGAAMLGIYLLMVLQTSSFIMPLVIMSAIPLTAIGIMPGFWLLNVFATESVGGFGNPVFFTATAMIGMIALGGIVVRNSIVLLEFIQDSIKQGNSLRDAILKSGAVRFRPIVLTAATTALGAWPITMDPIFSGLGWALIFGLIASTAFTLVVVPVMVFMVFRNRDDVKS